VTGVRVTTHHAVVALDFSEHLNGRIAQMNARTDQRISSPPHESRDTLRSRRLRFHRSAALYLTTIVAAILPSFAEAADAPYGLAARSAPVAPSAEVVLPEQIGPFTRASVRGDIEHDDEVYATYSDGTVSVEVTAGLTAGPDEAREGVKTARDVISRTHRKDFASLIESLDGDPAYVRVSEGELHFIAWNRERFFFSVDSKSGAAGLDRFMKVFPY
jgi:hypothetical protein